MELAGKKKLILISGRAHPQLSADIARELGIDLLPTDARTFANGEIYARFDESVRGTDAFVIQSHCSPINEWCRPPSQRSRSLGAQRDSRRPVGLRPNRSRG
jgi:ribose-phosphate pyrophosphokinase